MAVTLKTGGTVGGGKKRPEQTGLPGKRDVRGWDKAPDKGTPPPQMHRVLPHSIEAEQGILGSMMISPRDTISEVVGQVSEETFYNPSHQAVFGVLVAMWDKNQPIDLLTVTQRLSDLGQLQTLGGPVFVTSLYTFVPTAANVNYYVEIVREKYLLRKIIAAGTEAVRLGFEGQDEVSSVVDQVEASFIGIGDDRFKVTLVHAKETVSEAMELMERACERGERVTGIATGFADLDKITTGLQPSEMIVIAARPSAGKSALIMNIAAHAAVELGLGVGVFSLEMSRLQLIQRMMAARAKVNLESLRGGKLEDRDFRTLPQVGSKIGDSKLFIDDSSSLPILELRARARRMRQKFHVELIVIDYLQLLRSGSKRAQQNRELEISEISAGIKSLCKELSIPIIVAAQLNRQPEARAGGRPRLSDLRESGSIEQDADIVGLLFRPEMYEDDEEARRELAGEAELIIAKNRNGSIGQVPLTFLKEFACFEDRALQSLPRHWQDRD